MKAASRLMLSTLMLMLAIAGCAGDSPQKSKIVLGQTVPSTGEMAMLTKGVLPIYDMWVEDVNAKGGLYIKEYDKRLPLEVLRYDNASITDTMAAQLEQLIVQDKVDLLFPPIGTMMLYAAAPIANSHEYILLGGPGAAVKLKEIIAGLPYFFSVLNFADTQVPALADVLVELQVQSVAILFVKELHGIEYSGVAIPEFSVKGIDVKVVQSYSVGDTTLAPFLDAAQAAGVDAVVSFSLMSESILLTREAIARQYSPKVFYCSVGPSYSVPYKTMFGGPAAVEGVMGAGGWNAKTSTGAQEFIDKYMARWQTEPDYWGGLQYYASLQFLEQAIEKAGTLDQKKIRDVMASETFDTYMGPMWFKGGFNQNHPGEVSQWQNGVYETVGTAAQRTAAPEPKPAWPAPSP